MKYKDYYAILGVAKDADLDQIKKAYRKLARTHHPDLSKKSDAEAQFKEVAEAYSTLKDPEKREAYDALGRARVGGDFTPPPSWQDQYQDAPSSFDQMDLADLLASLNQRSSRSYQTRQAQAGQDLENTVEIGLQEALVGPPRRLKIKELVQEKELEVSIPAGVHAGKKLRLKGLGGKGLNSGPPGDLYLHIELLAHPVFKPLGRDLYFELALTPWEAVLGCEIEIPTLEEPVLLSVPAHTKNAQKLRIKSRGLGVPKGSRGDLYAVVHIETPSELSVEEEQLYQKLRELSSFNPRVQPHTRGAQK